MVLTVRVAWLWWCRDDDDDDVAMMMTVISQSPRGIFINQSKYALESLRKYGIESSDPVDTLMVKKSKLDEDAQGKAMDPTHYRGMISTLMYLTASRPDLTFVDSSVALTAYADADHTDHSLPTMALDSIKFQCNVITKALLPYAAIMFNILDQSILTSDSISSKSKWRMEKVPGHKFVDPPFKEDILVFMSDLGYPWTSSPSLRSKLNFYLKPWRAFEQFINNVRRLSLSNQKIRCSKGNKDMYYPDSTQKVIINLFMSQGSINPRRNKNLKAYKTTMLFASGMAIPKPNMYVVPTRRRLKCLPKAFFRYKSSGKRIKATAKVAKSRKRKQHCQRTQISWRSSDEEDNDDVVMSDDADDNDDQNDDDTDNESDDDQDDDQNDDDDLVHPKLSTFDEKERQDDEDKEEELSDDEAYDDENQGANFKGDELDKEETNEENEANELYRDVNVNLEGRDTEMIDAPHTIVQTTQVIEDTHVIITPINLEGQQQSSSVSSGFVSNMLNPSPDTGIDFIFNLNTESTSLVDVPVTTIAETPLSSATTLPPPPIPLITLLQQTPVPTPTTVPSSSLYDLLNFGSLFGFDHRLKTLEDDFSEFKQKNQFIAVVSSIPGIVDTYLANKMNEAVKTAVQLQSNRLRVKEQVNAQVSKILSNIEKTVNEQLEVEVLTRSSNESKTSHVVAANLSELELKKILIDKMERNKSIHRSDEQKNLYKALVDAYESDKLILDTYGDTVSFRRRRDNDDKDEEPSAGSNRGSKRKRAGKEPESTSAPKERPPRQLASLLKEDTRDSFDKLMDTPLDFSAFMINQLKVDILAPELLAGPTFELMKGSCKSLVKLEYFLEEVYKATMDQLD
ncbi:reverse transcriptase domain-containing protein [Tanacetum coccineum]